MFTQFIAIELTLSHLNKGIQLAQIVVLCVPKTWWAEALLAIHAKEIVLESRNNGGAPATLRRLICSVWSHHPLASMVMLALLEFSDTLMVGTKSKPFFGSS